MVQQPAPEPIVNWSGMNADEIDYKIATRLAMERLQVSVDQEIQQQVESRLQARLREESPQLGSSTDPPPWRASPSPKAMSTPVTLRVV